MSMLDDRQTAEAIFSGTFATVLRHHFRHERVIVRIEDSHAGSAVMCEASLRREGGKFARASVMYHFDLSGNPQQTALTDARWAVRELERAQ